MKNSVIKPEMMDLERFFGGFFVVFHENLLEIT
jgi:hypothetical protein